MDVNVHKALHINPGHPPLEQPSVLGAKIGRLQTINGPRAIRWWRLPINLFKRLLRVLEDLFFVNSEIEKFKIATQLTVEHMAHGKLAGSAQLSAATEMKEILDEIKTAKKNRGEPWPQDLEKMTQALAFFKYIGEKQQLFSSPCGLGKIISKKITNMSENETIAVPIGLKRHSMVLYIEPMNPFMKGQGPYKVTVFNTGLGIDQYHHKKAYLTAIPADHLRDNIASRHSEKSPIKGSFNHPNDGQSLRADPASSPREKSSAGIATYLKYQTAYEINNVSSLQLTDLQFWEKIFRCENDESPRNLYEKVLPKLGAMEKQSRDPRLWSHGQIGGSCSPSSLRAMFRAKLDKTTYKLFRDFTKKRFILHSWEQIQSGDERYPSLQKIVTLEVIGKFKQSLTKRKLPQSQEAGRSDEKDLTRPQLPVDQIGQIRGCHSCNDQASQHPVEVSNLSHQNALSQEVEEIEKSLKTMVTQSRVPWIRSQKARDLKGNRAIVSLNNSRVTVVRNGSDNWEGEGVSDNFNIAFDILKTGIPTANLEAQRYIKNDKQMQDDDLEKLIRLGLLIEKYCNKPLTIQQIDGIFLLIDAILTRIDEKNDMISEKEQVNLSPLRKRREYLKRRSEILT